ncbi:MAG: hypothetical protein RXR82_00805 [Nitrososphaeria archaeon]
MDMGRLRARPPRDAGLPRSRRGNSIDAYLFIRRLVRRYGRVPIYTDGAGWCADACRWAGAIADGSLPSMVPTNSSYAMRPAGRMSRP